MVRAPAVMLILGIASRAGGQQLAPQELAQAIALGQGCQAPIIRLSSSRADFEMFVESPFARAALVSATARHDASAARRAARQTGDAPWVPRLDRYTAPYGNSVLVVAAPYSGRRATGAPAGAERGDGAPRAEAWGVRGGEAPRI